MATWFVYDPKPFLEFNPSAFTIAVDDIYRFLILTKKFVYERTKFDEIYCYKISIKNDGTVDTKEVEHIIHNEKRIIHSPFLKLF